MKTHSADCLIIKGWEKKVSSCVSSAPQRIQRKKKRSSFYLRVSSLRSRKPCQSLPRLHLSSAGHSPRYLPPHLPICRAGAGVRASSVSSSAVSEGHPSWQLHYVDGGDAEDSQRMFMFYCSAPSVRSLWTPAPKPGVVRKLTPSEGGLRGCTPVWEKFRCVFHSHTSSVLRCSTRLYY